jgi:fluoride ion exporter CrcB/FEX
VRVETPAYSYGGPIHTAGTELAHNVILKTHARTRCCNITKTNAQLTRTPRQTPTYTSADITEAFHTHHVNFARAAKLLRQYKVRDITAASATPSTKLQRNSPLTFHKDDFYCTLRSRVWDVLRTTLGTAAPAPTRTMNCISALLIGIVLAGFAATLGALWLWQQPQSQHTVVLLQSGILASVHAFVAACVWLSWKRVAFACAIATGAALSLLTIHAHNFFHKRDNWRMYLFDISCLSSFEWRTTHGSTSCSICTLFPALAVASFSLCLSLTEHLQLNAILVSHHLWPNSSHDIEVAGLMPFLNYLPQQKPFVQRTLVYVYMHAFYCVALPLELLKRFVLITLRKQSWRWEHALPLLEFAILAATASAAAAAAAAAADSKQLFAAVASAACLFGAMHMACSYCFAFIGLVAAHHHPECWHQGDAARSRSTDFGLVQLDAVRDRRGVNENLLLVSVSFGAHALHHCFPTIDHSRLPLLVPVFLRTCREFGYAWQLKSAYAMASGKFTQLRRQHVHLSGGGSGASGADAADAKKQQKKTK